MGEVSVTVTPKLWVLGNLFRSSTVEQGTFYRHLRPIAVASLLLGSLPLVGVCSRDGRQLRHRWLDPRVALDAVVFLVAAGAFTYIALFSHSSRDVAAAAGHVSRLTDLLAWLILVHGCAQFILCHKTASRLPSLIADLEDAYQRHGVRGRLDNTLRKFGVWLFVVMLAVVVFSLALGFLSYNGVTRPILEEVFIGPCYMRLTMPITTSMVLYSFFVLSLVALFRDARESLTEVLAPKNGLFVDDLRLSDERQWYTTLCGLVSKVEACFGMHIFVNIGLTQAEMIIDIYIFLVLRKTSDILYVTLILYEFALMFFLNNLTSRLSTQANKVLNDLRAVPVSKLSTNGQFEVTRFISQIIACPAQISAAGYFVVDKSVITSVLSSVATYLIVLIYFTPYFLEQPQK